MNQYVVVSEIRRRGERIDVPSRAEDLSVWPTENAGLVMITYLDPVSRISLGHSSDARVDIDKQ